MTNAQLKQKAIQEAYGEHWEQVKDFVNANGWIKDRDVDLVSDMPMEFSTHDNDWYDTRRPLSLKGIESNMGWLRIEPDGSNLPTTEGKYFVYSTVDWHPFYRTDVFCGRLSNAVHHVTGKPIFTHYRPVTELPKPIY